MIRFLRPQIKFYGDIKPTILQSVLSLICSSVNAVIGVFMVFYLRDAIVVTAELSPRVSVWAIQLVEYTTAMVLGISWLIFVFVSQHYYEKDFIQSWIPKRFLVYTAIQVGILGLSIWYLHSPI